MVLELDGHLIRQFRNAVNEKGFICFAYKVSLVAVIASALIAGYFLSIKEENRWLFLNGEDATRYAKASLNKDISYMPEDKLIDYVVSSENGYVLFSEYNNSEFIYGYFPYIKQVMNDPKLTWNALTGNWFLQN